VAVLGSPQEAKTVQSEREIPLPLTFQFNLVNLLFSGRCWSWRFVFWKLESQVRELVVGSDRRSRISSPSWELERKGKPVLCKSLACLRNMKLNTSA